LSKKKVGRGMKQGEKTVKSSVRQPRKSYGGSLGKGREKEKKKGYCAGNKGGRHIQEGPTPMRK